MRKSKDNLWESILSTMLNLGIKIRSSDWLSSKHLYPVSYLTRSPLSPSYREESHTSQGMCAAIGSRFELLHASSILASFFLVISKGDENQNPL